MFDNPIEKIDREPLKRLKHKWNMTQRDFVGDLMRKIEHEKTSKIDQETIREKTQQSGNEES